MISPPGTRVAKEFLVQCIVAESKREGVPLTDTEREMLYFSETHWAPANILEVNEVFERDYDSAEYEHKITGLIRNFKRRAERESRAQLDDWNHAVAEIAAEDHYLLVMIGAADDVSSARRSLSIIVIGIIGGIAALLITFVILFIVRR